MVLILFIILYFSIVGGLFYKFYISTPIEQNLVNGLIIEPIMEVEGELHEPVKAKFNSNEAADINVG